MRQQGSTNNQIIQELQNQGYNSQQIFDAMNVSEPTNMPAGPIEGMNQGMPSAPPMGGEPMPAPEQAMPSPAEMDPIGGQMIGGERERIEEMAEAIIDEKWEELVKSINKIIEWKDKMEGRITKIEQELKDTKTSFDQLHNSIIGKINEYDKNIVNVGTEVKAMGKVFEKVMPTFTENVSELKRIVNKKK
jgi:DNA-binding transcriptional MerR regulator